MKPGKETVIVVHGTFSAKNESGPPNWYAPKQFFCNQLDNELDKRGSNARCWAHLGPKDDFFHWDGRNDWLSRAAAATRLRKEIKRLKSAGWIVHLVGHSHGGNVMIDATTDSRRETQSWLNGRAALFGTPIYRPGRVQAGRRRLLRLGGWIVLSLLVWLAIVALSTRGFNPLAAFGVGASTEYVAYFVAATVFMAVLYFALSLAGVFATPKDPMPYRWSPAFLAINTPFDEAYRSLAGLPGSENPLLADKLKPAATDESQAEGADPSQPAQVDAPPSRWSAFAQVLESVRGGLAGKIRQTLQTVEILPMVVISVLLLVAALAWRPVVTALTSQPLSEAGLSLAFVLTLAFLLVAACFSRRRFAHAMLVPGIVVANIVQVVLKTVFGLLMVAFDTVVKNAAWGVVKSLSLGIVGSPRKAGDIDVSLEPGGDNLYLELPEEIVYAVKAQQKPHLDKIQELLYQPNLKWSPGELRDELEDIDFPMIHTTYYRNAACIEKAADWIAEPVMEYWDGHHQFDTRRPISGGFGAQEKHEGPNAYKNHIGRLALRISDPGSIWRSPLGPSQLAWVARRCGLPYDTWEEIEKAIHEKSEMPSRMPHPPAREK